MLKTSAYLLGISICTTLFGAYGQGGSGGDSMASTDSGSQADGGSGQDASSAENDPQTNEADAAAIAQDTGSAGADEDDAVATGQPGTHGDHNGDHHGHTDELHHMMQRLQNGSMSWDDVDQATRSRMRERMANWTNGNSTMPRINLTMPEWDHVDSQDVAVDAVERLELLDASTWGVAHGHVDRCPVHLPAQVTVLGDGGLEMALAYQTRKMFSMVDGNIPADLSHYDGIEVQFSTEAITQFKIRLSHGGGQRGLRFIAIINVNSDGAHTLWVKWSDFHAEKISRMGVDPCVATESCGALNTHNLTHFAVIIPVEKRSDWSAKFTFHHVTADVLGTPTPPPTSNHATATDSSDTDTAAAVSAQVQSSDQAKATKFEYEDDGNVVAGARDSHHSILYTFYAIAAVYLAKHVF